MTPVSRWGWTLLAIVVTLWAVVAPAQASAQERILFYDSEIDIREDGSLDVTEHITVRAEGRQIRRGIYRDFPTRYRDQYGNRVRVDFELISVERDGQPEPSFTERVSNGIRINTGDDSLLPVPAEYTFTLRYRTTRQLGFFEEHDELYWNAIGTGWDFPIEGGVVEVRLPEPVPIDSMRVEGYTGAQGAQGDAYEAERPAPGVARFRLTEALQPREGFTVVLAFPKGIISQPTRAQAVRWFLSDNGGVLVALLGLIGLWIFCVRRWREIGRDPREGVIIPRYEPPQGHTPGGLRYLGRMNYDTRSFSGDVLSLAVAGWLRIHSSKKLFKEEWRIDRLDSGRPILPAQRTLLDGLFPGGSRELELKNTNAATVSGAQRAHAKALDAEYHPRYFKRNGSSTGLAAGILGVTALVAFLTAGGNGLPAIFLILAVMLVTVIVFGFLVRAPTPPGRELMDEVEGLKLYMSVAERDELARMPGPNQPPMLDASRFEALLPYAVALDVEDAWTKKFTAAVGAAAAAAATSGMAWYAGRGPITNIGDFSSAVGKSLSSQISSASSPPGSSSGSGGGGSSGGGGGGGGGGGR